MGAINDLGGHGKSGGEAGTVIFPTIASEPEKKTQEIGRRVIEESSRPVVMGGNKMV